jgi:Flp pilus assembly protein TadB
VHDSRMIAFIESHEQNHRPRPGLWLFTSLLYGTFATAALIGFAVLALTRPAKAGGIWVLLALAVVWASLVPLNVWRMKRDRQRRGSWVNPVRS